MMILRAIFLWLMRRRTRTVDDIIKNGGPIY